MQQPSVGRIVRYQSYGTPSGEYNSKSRAALITAVISPTVVSLAISNSNPTGLFFACRVNYGEGPGCWSWSPRDAD